MTDGANGPLRVRDGSGRDIAFEIALGGRIRAARMAAGMTQRALGDAVGIAYQKLQKYELGQDRIAVSTLQRIARALALHPGQLFDDPMPKTIGGTVGVMVARRSIELAQAAPDPHVVGRLLTLIDELGNDHSGQGERDLARPAVPPAVPLAAKLAVEPTHLTRGEPMQAVVDPLLKVLRHAGGDAGALARLLGQALAEAEKALKRSP